MRRIIEWIQESETACELLAFLPVMTFLVVTFILVWQRCM